MKGTTGTVKMPNNFDTVPIEDLRKKLLSIANIYGLKKRYYLASPWFDERADILCSTAQSIISSCGCNCFYPKEQDNKYPVDAFNKNVQEISKCDCLIALVSRKDVGTAWEIGMAKAYGKDIVLVGYDETTFLSHTNVMLAFCANKCITIDELGPFLMGKEVTGVKINNNWEGIE